MFYFDLFSALARHKVDYLLIGGLAVSLHGVERTTMDVDITVAMNPNNLASRAEVFKVANTDIQVVSIDDLIALKQAVGRPIDIMGIEHLQRIKAQ